MRSWVGGGRASKNTSENLVTSHPQQEPERLPRPGPPADGPGQETLSQETCLSHFPVICIPHFPKAIKNTMGNTLNVGLGNGKTYPPTYPLTYPSTTPATH